eukprot:COSAG06_NODE_4013_length_4661_cov_7.147742_3_plen_76_part_00
MFRAALEVLTSLGRVRANAARSDTFLSQTTRLAVAHSAAARLGPGQDAIITDKACGKRLLFGGFPMFCPKPVLVK